MNGSGGHPDIRLELRSDPRLLCAMRALVRAYLVALGRADHADQVVLAVDEACANALRHSYQGRTGERLVLCLREQDGQIEIELRDEGIPIPADRTRPPDLARLEAERMNPGGLGVHLIHRAFDEVLYEPGAHRGNRVLMRLHTPRRQEVENAADPER